MNDHRRIGVTRIYDRFNARDIDACWLCSPMMSSGPNGMDGGHVHGREAVREYWTRQWITVSPRVEPVSGFLLTKL
jgi:hypothetical protein